MCIVCGIEFHEIYSYGKQRWIDRKFCSQKCKCESQVGIPRSEETKLKISKSTKGIPKSEKTKKKMSNTRKGIPPSEECMKKALESHKGKPSSNKGKYRSEETKQKMSDAHKGIAREDLRGDKHPNWQGGISFDPYCPKFNNSLKEQIRDRDNRICQNCDKTELENKRKLTCHHVHYDKPNCYPDLICLCLSCNSIVNSNRNYWEEHFMKILEYRDLLI